MSPGVESVKENKMHLSKAEALIDLIQSFMNQAASHLTNRKEVQSAAEKERFFKGRDGVGPESPKQKKGLFQAGSPSFWGRQGSLRQMTSLVLAEKFQTDGIRLHS